MKILIATGIYPPDVGGPATYSKILFDELPKKGIEAGVVTYGKLSNLPWILRQPAYFSRIFLAARNVDIIYAQDILNSGISSYIAASIWRKRFLLKIVGDYAWEQGIQRFGVKEILDEFLDKKYGFMTELFKFLERFVAGRADKIIVPSEYLKKVVTKWGVTPEKIKVIYNAFEPPRFKEITPPAPLILRGAAREKLSLNQNDKIIISAGRLVPWKGFDALIEIMPEILKIIPDAKLIIIGDGPEKKNLESRIKNLESRIIMTGNLPRQKVLEYLAAADVFALNTSYEGLSHQILEAMAMGCPVVTTDVGGNPELISDGESGFLVKFNNKNALKSKILEVLNDTALAQKLVQNAKKKAQEFSLERMINETINLIKNT